VPYDNNGQMCLPTEILKTFEPWMLAAMRDAGQSGGTRNEIILVTGLSKRRFNAFLAQGGPDYNEDFEDAYQVASMCSQAYWENIGRDASKGDLGHHKSGTFQFMMKNNFRRDYKDEQTITHKGQDEIPLISKDISPVEASQKYKQLLLISSLGDFFED